MTVSPCELIDGYLGKWLDASDAAAFQNHLVGCAECRQAVLEQEEINRLLVAAQPEVPARLIRRFEQDLYSIRRRKALAWGVALAASVVMALFGVDRLLRNFDGERAQPVVVARDQTREMAPPTRVRVTFASDSEVIAVPQKTQNPGVTIIWVYPVLQTAVQPNTSPGEPVSNSERSES